MRLLEHPLYREDILNVIHRDYPWEKLSEKIILISGASGLIGSFLIDTILRLNKEKKLGAHVIAMGRDEDRLRERFAGAVPEDISFFVHDVAGSYGDLGPRPDIIFHLASNTHPMQYATDPIGTITTNILGLKNLLDLAADTEEARVVFASSVEIYGENRGDTEKFGEDYLGYIDCNTLRAGYPESKRCGETLCQAYIAQKNVDVVMPRLSRTYGPTMLSSDTKALSQFIGNGVKGEDIVLKSKGEQTYSYTYVADAVSALYSCLFFGECGGAYNVAASDVSLKELAEQIAKISGRQVIYDLPDETERAGYSTATKAMLDASKIAKLGWKPEYSMEAGLERTLAILKEIER